MKGGRPFAFRAAPNSRTYDCITPLLYRFVRYFLPFSLSRPPLSLVLLLLSSLSSGFPLHPFAPRRRGQRDGSEKFALTSFLKLDFDGASEREGGEEQREGWGRVRGVSVEERSTPGAPL